MDNRRGIGPADGEHLDATGERKVVYCHHCENEWWQDEHGLVCPRCDGEVTEVVEPDHDPRDLGSGSELSPSLRELRNHSPWTTLGADSDPEEADIEEHITHGPGGSIMISQTIRSSPVRRPTRTRPEPIRRRSSNPYIRTQDVDDRNHGEDDRAIMRQFQGMFRGLMESGGPLDGPPSRPGRHDFNDFFPVDDANPGRSFFARGSEHQRNRSGSNGGFTFSTHEGPNVMGSRITFTSGRVGPSRTIRAGAGSGDPPVNELTALLSNIFGNMSPPLGDQPRDGPRNAAHNFPALLAALMNPANAASGDAVYTQEALDRVISQLMEAHPTSSSAPGPAAPQTISSLPKRALTDQDLEGNKKVIGKNGEEVMKGECSVCMDDVGVGEEMVFLPCKHWFHDACASAWLSEHDSCPICRKSISGDGSSNPSNNSNGNNASGSSNGGSASRGGPFRRLSGGMGAAFGSGNWGSNNAFNNSPGASSNSGSNNGWGTSRPSFFTSAGRRERRRENGPAETVAERHEGMTGSAYYAHLAEHERRDAERNGSGSGGYSRWASASASTSRNEGNNNTFEPGTWSSRGGGNGSGIFGMGGRRGLERAGSTSRRYSNYGRVTPQRREIQSDNDWGRTRSTSPPDRPMPGAFSASPPRRDSARSSRSGSGSGNSGSGTGGGVLNWVRDRLPGGRATRSDPS